MRVHHQPLPATSTTGAIVLFPGDGSESPEQASFQCTVHGWILKNSDSAAHDVQFWVPAPAPANSGREAAIPTGSSPATNDFTITVAANSSKEFMDHQGVTFKDGLFVVTTNAAITGSLFVA